MAQACRIAETVAMPLPKMLVVDDLELNRELLSELLTAQGYQIETAVDGSSGLACATQQAFALLLLDVRLPDFNGDQLLARLRADPLAKSSRTPAIALTADAGMSERRELLAGGFAAVLGKPWRASALLEQIRILLGEPELPKQSSITADNPAPVFDEAKALASVNGSHALMLRMRALLHADLAKRELEMRAALNAADAQAFADVLHKLAASAGLTGARTLSEAVNAMRCTPGVAGAEHTALVANLELQLLRTSDACQAN